MLATRKKDDRSDDVLLNQFVATRDEGAFTILVARHARVVWDICYEALENEADTEDAFQRTFMLLAQRAEQIISRKSVCSWLIGAARNQCMTLRRSISRQKRLAGKCLGPTRGCRLTSPRNASGDRGGIARRGGVPARVSTRPVGPTLSRG